MHYRYERDPSFDRHDLRVACEGAGKTQRRRSRRGLKDGSKRFRVRMRAAARCNDQARYRWADFQAGQ
jgi:hypothetical protein